MVYTLNINNYICKPFINKVEKKRCVEIRYEERKKREPGINERNIRPGEKTMKRKPKRFSEYDEDLRRGLIINEVGGKIWAQNEGSGYRFWILSCWW